MKTLKQESEEAWNRFDWEKAPVKKKYGVGIDMKMGCVSFPVDEFVVEAGCNVFHWDDVADALFSINWPFELNFWKTEGRTRFFQIHTKGHLINIRACGYGTGDYIIFSKGFPKEPMVKILRELAMDSARKTRDHYTSGSPSKYDTKKLKQFRTLLDVYFECVTSIQDLKNLAEYFSLKTNIKCTKSLVKEKPNDFLTKERIDQWKKNLPKAEARFRKLRDTKILKDYFRLYRRKDKW